MMKKAVCGLVICTGKADYTFVADPATEAVYFYRGKGPGQSRMGERRCCFNWRESFPVVIKVKNGVIKLYFNENPLDEDPYPKFEFYCESFEGGYIQTIGEVYEADIRENNEIPLKENAYYINPVAPGADPDILYYEGKYYLYNRTGNKEAPFKVSVSEDLVHWRVIGPVFFNKPEYEVRFYMSPNVFYKDGWFYMIYSIEAEAATGQKQKMNYAVSRSPLGPFEHGPEGQVPLHPGVPEIGGHPFIDEDGTLWLALVRFGGGNFIWFEACECRDGKIIPKTETCTLIIPPTESYETDGHGKIAEGGVCFKHKGLYYMIYATGHYIGHYGEGYAVADNPRGPWKKYKYNRILNYTCDVDGGGDGIVVRSPSGELFMVYHTHLSPTEVEPRQTCIDRMKFVPDPDGGPDILSFYGPTNTPQPLPR